jgi:methionyl-tRNA formyltransferase
MHIVFMGSPAFAVPALQSLMSNKYDISAVFTQPDKKTGRGQQVMACPVKQYAVSMGLNVVQPETFKDQAEVEKLRALAPDIIVVAAYGQILPDSVLQIPKYKSINIHPSLLPKYRGPSPVTAAILNGDALTGVTIMLVEKKVDSGPILSFREMAVGEEDTTGTLTGRLAILGAEMLVETIPGWVAGKIQPVVQDESLASYTKMENKEDGKLKWDLPAVELWRMIRAYQPWPGCFTTWNNARLKIIKAIPLPDTSPHNTGEVIALPRGGLARVAVRTGNGLLGLETLQLEGKKEMPAADFIAGHRDFIGAIL